MRTQKTIGIGMFGTTGWRLEPRAFSVGGVDSLDGGFVW
jgi:hypothetical protein